MSRLANMPRHGRCLALLLPLVLLLQGGCFRLERQQLTQRIDVVTQPPGGQIWVQDRKGKQHVGQAPVQVSRKHVRVTRKFNRWHWLWTAVSAIGVGVGAAMVVSDESNDTISSDSKVGGIVLATVAGSLALSSLILNLSFEATSGAVISGSEQVMIGSSMPGHRDGWAKVVIPGADRKVKIALGPGNEPAKRVFGVGGLGVRGRARGHGVLGVLNTTKRFRPIVAVFRIQDAGKRKFKPTLLDQLTDYLSAQITAVSGYRTVPRDQLRERLSQQRKRSYRACYEEACQIQLGKALAAQKSLATRLLKVGPRCALTAVLYDLKSETAGSAASAETSCSVDALMAGIRDVAKKLRPKP